MRRSGADCGIKGFADTLLTLALPWRPGSWVLGSLHLGGGGGGGEGVRGSPVRARDSTKVILSSGPNAF